MKDMYVTTWVPNKSANLNYLASLIIVFGTGWTLFVFKKGSTVLESTLTLLGLTFINYNIIIPPIVEALWNH